jgi:hypothetical protein
MRLVLVPHQADSIVVVRPHHSYSTRRCAAASRERATIAEAGSRRIALRLSVVSSAHLLVNVVLKIVRIPSGYWIVRCLYCPYTFCPICQTAVRLRRRGDISSMLFLRPARYVSVRN